MSRQQAIAAFANFGVKPEQIFPAISVGGLEEITLDHIPVLRGMFAALKSGEATVEEMFPAPRPAGGGGSAPVGLKNKLDALAAQPEPAVVEPEPEPASHDPETGEVEPTERDEIDAPEDDARDQPAEVDASTEVYQDMHALISDGASYLAARNKLSPERLALLGKDQIEALKKLAGGAK